MNHLLQMELEEYPKKKAYQRMLQNQLITYQQDLSLERFKKQNPPQNAWLSEHISKADRFNHEYYVYLSNQFLLLEDEVKMLESSVEALPNDLRDIARMLLLKGETWDTVSDQLHISRTTLARYRNRALEILSSVYDRYEKDEIARMLS